MKRNPILLAVLLLLSSFASAQRPVCAFDRLHKNKLATDRQYRLRTASQAESIRQYIQRNKARLSAKTYRTMAAMYTIPVVVHVVHTGGAVGTTYNPTDAQIVGAINYLNQVYAGTWNGTEGIGDIEIQFVLARRDPNCNPTNGINRVNGAVIANYAANGVDVDDANTSNEADELDVKNLIRWDPSSYYNIWIVNKIDGLDGTSGSFTAGFAYFPIASANLDGTIMLATQMQAGEKTLPHEIGHALALYHPFEGSSTTVCAANTNCNSQGDGVCDTDPITLPASFSPRSGTNACTGTSYTINTERNYMNYTTDYTLFTAGQKARMLAAMALPSRACFASSLGAFAPDEGTVCTPKINFEIAEDQKTETSVATTGCRTYSDYTYNMVIGSAPSATATATLTIAGGTATEGVDFDITTNGNFSSPSKSLSFASGSTAPQSFTVRVYNDAIVDGTESVTLGFAVNAGGGNAVAGNGKPNLVLTIGDNDSAPRNPSVITASIGSSAVIVQSPFAGSVASRKNQILYTASELQAAGISAGNLHSFALNINKASASSFQYQGLTIKIGQTSQNTLYTPSVDIPVNDAGFTTVYNANYSTVNGWNTFNFSTPFTWNGTSNIVIVICYSNSSTNSDDAVHAFFDGNPNTRYVFRNGVNCSGNFNSLSYYNSLKPIARFTYADAGTMIQSTLNTSKTEYLGPNADVYFYDQTDNKLLARIRNLSSHNYGCTQVVIDRAGSGTSPFWNSNVSDHLMNKTLRVLPTNNNPSGQYEITLYYSDAEKAGWEDATGQSWSSIQLVKVPSQISNYSPATPNPDGPATVQTATPTRGTLGNQHWLSATFNNGFSGFGAGIAGIALPVNLVSFDGLAEKQSILVKWTTSFEQNTRDFDVEKSSDGIHFYRIGTVLSHGNTGSGSQYTLPDYHVGDVNYYRLRLNDADGRYTLSKVILVKQDKAVQNLWVINNPFNQYLDMRFAKKAHGAKLQLINTNGSIVAEESLVQPSGQIRWDLRANLAGGVYILRAIIDGELFTYKVMKE